ncbi:MAG: class I SAM-dependent methyltransferase [Dehalococcoidia bacterium]
MTQPDVVYGDDELAALYDLVYAHYTDDLSLYEQFAARGETPSLELAAGSGRVALHLARNGHRVVGIDTSRPMLARFEAALDDTTRSNIRLVEADMRDFDLGETFDLVYCALDSFEQLLTNDDAISALRCVARHLNLGGVFVTELRTLRSVDWAPSPQAPLSFEWTRQDPGTGGIITKLSSMRASPATQTTTTTLIFDRAASDGTVRRRTFDVTLRVFGRHEFELLLAHAGLRVTQRYGDYDLSPLTDDGDTMIVVAEREGA